MHDNLRNLGLDALDVVNLRVPDEPGSMEDAIDAPLAVLADLKCKGLMRHIGLSNIEPPHLAAAERITPIVCVQNQYNLVHPDDDAFIDDIAKCGIA